MSSLLLSILYSFPLNCTRILIYNTSIVPKRNACIPIRNVFIAELKVLMTELKLFPHRLVSERLRHIKVEQILLIHHISTEVETYIHPGLYLNAQA